MSEKDHRGEANYTPHSSREWVEHLLAYHQLDDATATDVSPLDVAVESAMKQQPVGEILRAQYDIDPGVLLKNELLLMMLDLAERRSLHVDDFLALLERQARGTAFEQETRYRQFMGLLDLLTVVAKNQALLDRLKELGPEITPDDES